MACAPLRPPMRHRQLCRRNTARAIPPLAHAAAEAELLVLRCRQAAALHRRAAARFPCLVNVYTTCQASFWSSSKGRPRRRRFRRRSSQSPHSVRVADRWDGGAEAEGELFAAQFEAIAANALLLMAKRKLPAHHRTGQAEHATRELRGVPSPMKSPTASGGSYCCPVRVAAISPSDDTDELCPSCDNVELHRGDDRHH